MNEEVVKQLEELKMVTIDYVKEGRGYVDIGYSSRRRADLSLRESYKLFNLRISSINNIDKDDDDDDAWHRNGVFVSSPIKSLIGDTILDITTVENKMTHQVRPVSTVFFTISICNEDSMMQVVVKSVIRMHEKVDTVRVEYCER